MMHEFWPETLNRRAGVIGAGSSSEADIHAVFGNDSLVKFMKPGKTRKF